MSKTIRWDTHVSLTPEEGYDMVTAQEVATRVALKRLSEQGLILIPDSINCYQITGQPGSSRILSLSCSATKKGQLSLL